MNVRQGDLVEVISGKDRGKRGKILRVIPKENRVVVEGVNIVKRHVKAQPPKIMQGGIQEGPAPLHRSNVMLVCPHCHRRTRIGAVILADGRKARKCVRCGEIIDR
ncbi:MAG: 50S ribosomal protein L24 [Clostridiales bacterium]|nr:50S ribosomal protein L24 [Clostridiales bacterium]